MSGGQITGPGSNDPDRVPVMLSPGVGVVSRAMFDRVGGLAYMRAINGCPTDIVIVEPDGTLTEIPHDADDE